MEGARRAARQRPAAWSWRRSAKCRRHWPRSPSGSTWLGRAYKAGGLTSEADALFEEDRRPGQFQRNLADEELGRKIVVLLKAKAPTAEEQKAARDNPGIRLGHGLLPPRDAHRSGQGVELVAGAAWKTAYCWPLPTWPDATRSGTAPSTPPTARRTSTISRCASSPLTVTRCGPQRRTRRSTTPGSMA